MLIALRLHIYLFGVILVDNPCEKIMAGMIYGTRFRFKEGQAEAFFKFLLNTQEITFWMIFCITSSILAKENVHLSDLSV